MQSWRLGGEESLVKRASSGTRTVLFDGRCCRGRYSAIGCRPWSILPFEIFEEPDPGGKTSIPRHVEQLVLIVLAYMLFKCADLGRRNNNNNNNN